MQELIYVSEKKLQMLQKDRRWWQLRSLRGEVILPGIAQLSVEASPADSRLKAAIEYVAGLAVWYDVDNLVAGQWVQFEAKLNYMCRDIGSDSSIVLFADVPGTGRRRLLLHGSANSLVRVHHATAEPPSLPAYDASSANIMPVLVNQVQDTDAAPISTSRHAAIMLRSLDKILDPRTAAEMYGFARVTAATPGRLPLVASPLFVAYLRDDQ